MSDASSNVRQSRNGDGFDWRRGTRRVLEGVGARSFTKDVSVLPGPLGFLRDYGWQISGPHHVRSRHRITIRPRGFLLLVSTRRRQPTSVEPFSDQDCAFKAAMAMSSAIIIKDVAALDDCAGRSRDDKVFASFDVQDSRFEIITDKKLLGEISTIFWKAAEQTVSAPTSIRQVLIYSATI